MVDEEKEKLNEKLNSRIISRERKEGRSLKQYPKLRLLRRENQLKMLGRQILEALLSKVNRELGYDS